MILSFRGENAVYSNFWPYLGKRLIAPPAPLTFGDETFQTREHAFQWCKTLDPNWRARIQNAKTPGDAKQLGRECPLRPDWKTVEKVYMYMVVGGFFQQYPEHRDRLVETGNEPIFEGNWWGDTFWGIDLKLFESLGSPELMLLHQPEIFGQNWLGKTLMFLRREFQTKRDIAIAAKQYGLEQLLQYPRVQ